MRIYVFFSSIKSKNIQIQPIQIKPNGADEFVLLGLLKIKCYERKASKERVDRNPQTGAEITIPAKPDH